MKNIFLKLLLMFNSIPNMLSANMLNNKYCIFAYFCNVKISIYFGDRETLSLIAHPKIQSHLFNSGYAVTSDRMAREMASINNETLRQ